MNAIMDLTARTVSFITVIQTTLLKGAINSNAAHKDISILSVQPQEFEAMFRSFVHMEVNSSSDTPGTPQQDNFCVRAEELVWVSANTPNRQVAVSYATNLCIELVKWICNEDRGRAIHDALVPFGKYPSPFKWRSVLSTILYEQPEERVKLATALQYLPIQVVLALGGGDCCARDQRMLQMWKVSDDDKPKLLTNKEIKLLNKFTLQTQQMEASPEALLKDGEKLCSYLIKNNAPLPFEYVFTAELKEIEANRERRNKEKMITGIDAAMPSPPANAKDETVAAVAAILPKQKEEARQIDPFKKGKDMQLFALAFSGGGIRSATFNLGILQGLAKNGLLSRFDYLSTVSGGGYIGSWLAAWIKREGSVAKVTNRLNPNKSPNPLGEELRPIRWLRMYSNYFAPNASAMSADSWTIGITWLRNTLLNQVVIFLMLLSLLFTGNLLYELWYAGIKHNITYSALQVFAWSAALLVPVALLAGLGMHAYHSENIGKLKVKRAATSTISTIILAIAFVAAYVVSGWLSSQWSFDVATYSKVKTLLPTAYITFGCLLLVAALGKYDNCIKSYHNNAFAAWLILLFTSTLTTIIGLLCLAFAWTILEKIDTSTTGYFSLHKTQTEFIVGVPLIIEVFSITLVARMAFLGKYFPDERREWWGRMGAHVHRLAFLWILITASALLGEEWVKGIFDTWWTGVAATGGWMALVATTVKAAFSSKTSGKEESKSSSSGFLNVLGLAGPYLFALGLLIFLPGLIDPLNSLVKKIVTDLNLPNPDYEWNVVCIIVITAIAATLLSRQIGVNEFSMHHFYRNRLVRAYLGATRRSTDRQRTSNPFTGFDMLDDEKLSEMRNECGYYGPYPVLNAALNASQVADLDRQDRKAESFIFSPLYCGFDFSMIKPSADVNNKSYDYAYRQTKDYAYKDKGPGIGTAMAISGAAINPNQGYHSSPATAFLLTVFNVQMGWWIGNPRKRTWQCSDPRLGIGYIMNNLMGKTNTRNNFVALSDGGHFDNMGLYEMIRRKCPVILLCDAEQDGEFTCEGLAMAIRRCRIDFGADIDIDISDIVRRRNNRFSKEHFAIGTIKYADEQEPTGTLIYIKSSITGNESVDIYEYAAKNTTFPHQTTGDQFFNEEQFESYRKLGLHIIEHVLQNHKAASVLGLEQARNTENKIAKKEYQQVYYFNEKVSDKDGFLQENL